MLRFAPGPVSHRQSRGGSGQARTSPGLRAASSVGSFAAKSYHHAAWTETVLSGFLSVNSESTLNSGKR